MDLHSHKHRCDVCSFVWQHPHNAAGIDRLHRCPRCSRSQYKVYEGRDKPELIQEGPGLRERLMARIKALTKICTDDCD